MPGTTSTSWSGALASGLTCIACLPNGRSTFRLVCHQGHDFLFYDVARLGNQTWEIAERGSVTMLGAIAYHMVGTVWVDASHHIVGTTNTSLVVHRIVACEYGVDGVTELTHEVLLPLSPSISVSCGPENTLLVYDEEKGTVDVICARALVSHAEHVVLRTITTEAGWTQILTSGPNIVLFSDFTKVSEVLGGGNGLRTQHPSETVRLVVFGSRPMAYVRSHPTTPLQGLLCMPSASKLSDSTWDIVTPLSECDLLAYHAGTGRLLLATIAKKIVHTHLKVGQSPLPLPKESIWCRVSQMTNRTEYKEQMHDILEFLMSTDCPPKPPPTESSSETQKSLPSWRAGCHTPRRPSPRVVTMEEYVSQRRQDAQDRFQKMSEGERALVAERVAKGLRRAAVPAPAPPKQHDVDAIITRLYTQDIKSRKLRVEGDRKKLYAMDDANNIIPVKCTRNDFDQSCARLSERLPRRRLGGRPESSPPPTPPPSVPAIPLKDLAQRFLYGPISHREGTIEKLTERHRGDIPNSRKLGADEMADLTGRLSPNIGSPKLIVRKKSGRFYW